MTVADSDGMWRLRLVFLPLVFPSLSFLLQPTTSSLSHSLPPPPFPYPLFFDFFLCFSASPNLSRSSLYLCFFLSAPSSPLLSFGFFSYVSFLRFPVLSSSPFSLLSVFSQLYPSPPPLSLLLSPLKPSLSDFLFFFLFSSPQLSFFLLFVSYPQQPSAATLSVFLNLPKLSSPFFFSVSFFPFVFPLALDQAPLSNCSFSSRPLFPSAPSSSSCLSFSSSQPKAFSPIFLALSVIRPPPQPSSDLP